MLISLFQKKNSCFICSRLSNDFICSKCREKLSFYQNLRGRSSFKNCELYFTAPYHLDYKRLVWDLKFGKNTGLAKSMAYLLLETYFMNIKEIPEIISSIPMGPLKERQRGFNQSELLARELAKLLGKKSFRLLNRNDKVSLYRGNVDRESLVKGTMEYIGGDARGNVLVIDDVFTTGSTMREAYRVLSEVGFKKITFIFFARQESQENLISWFS